MTVRSRVEGEIQKIHFHEGQMVKAGDLLAEIDPRPFERQRDQAKGAVARDEASLNLARLNLKRQEELLRSNATTQAQYDQQFATVAQAEAVLETNQAVLKNTELQLTYCRIVAPIDGRRRFKGPLAAVSTTTIEVTVDGLRRAMPIAAVRKAHLAPQF